MEMILRSVDCFEEIANIKSPKKAFMDDITLLTEDQEVMRNVLSRLDELITYKNVNIKSGACSLVCTHGLDGHCSYTRYLSEIIERKCSIYRVIQNFASPSRAENRQASAQLTISPSNTFNLNWENQILDSETFYNCCKFNFPKRGFVLK